MSNVYEVYVKIVTHGDNETDAVETIFSAIDLSNVLNEDGIVSIEVLEDTVELLEVDTNDYTEEDE